MARSLYPYVSELMKTTRTFLFLAFAMVLFFMQDLMACSVCFTATEDTREAFYVTTILLTCTPLALIGGAVFFINRRLRAEYDDTQS
jgi:Na+-driven multidrug efflux pump